MILFITLWNGAEVKEIYGGLCKNILLLSRVTSSSELSFLLK